MTARNELELKSRNEAETRLVERHQERHQKRHWERFQGRLQERHMMTARNEPELKSRNEAETKQKRGLSILMRLRRGTVRSGAGTLSLFFPRGFLRFNEASKDLRQRQSTWTLDSGETVSLFTGDWECQNLVLSYDFALVGYKIRFPATCWKDTNTGPGEAFYTSHTWILTLRAGCRSV